MIPERGKLLKRSIPFFFVGLLVFIAYLYLFVPGGLLEIISILESTNLFLFLLAVCATFLDVVFFSLTWHYFLLPLSVKVPFKKTFLFVWVGIFVDLIVPAESISGEISRAYLMSRESTGNTGKIVASLISHRILAMLISLGSLITGVFAFFIIGYGLPPPFIINLIVFITAVTIIVVVFLLLLCLQISWTEKIVNSIIGFVDYVSSGRWREKLSSAKSKVAEALETFHEAIDILRRNPENLIRPIVFSVLSWTLSLLVSYIVFFSLGYHVSFSIVVIVSSITVAVKAIPIGIPFEIGLPEIVMTSLFVALDPAMSVAVAAAATVLIRILMAWFRFFIGFVAVQWVGIKVLTSTTR